MSNVELVLEAFPFDPQQGLEMCTAIPDDGLWVRATELTDPEASVRFILEGGGAIGSMAGPFHGVEGYRAGWSEWIEPWEELWVMPLEMIDAGEGRVLVIAQLRGRLRAGGGEVVEDAAGVFQVRDGKVAGIDHYLDRDQARRAVGLS